MLNNLKRRVILCFLFLWRFVLVLIPKYNYINRTVLSKYYGVVCHPLSMNQLYLKLTCRILNLYFEENQDRTNITIKTFSNSIERGFVYINNHKVHVPIHIEDNEIQCLMFNEKIKQSELELINSHLKYLVDCDAH